MGIFDLFGKKAKGQLPVETEEEEHVEELGVYSGIRVEVTTLEGQLLFVAKLLGLRGDKGELRQYSEGVAPKDGESLRVRIRGYVDREKKAVYMEGVITPSQENMWLVEELAVLKVGNDRAFFRLDTNIDATATMFGGLEMGEKPCKLLNISIGGASIRSKCRYHEGDKFLLKVRLLKDRPISAIFSEVVRITEKDAAEYEYGCRFLEMTDEDQEKITKNIFEAQCQSRRRS